MIKKILTLLFAFLVLTGIAMAANSDQYCIRDTSVQGSVEVGETITYTANTLDYEVTGMVVSGDQEETAVAKLIINDEVTPALGKGEATSIETGALYIRYIHIDSTNTQPYSNKIDFCINGHGPTKTENHVEVGEAFSIGSDDCAHLMTFQEANEQYNELTFVDYATNVHYLAHYENNLYGTDGHYLVLELGDTTQAFSYNEVTGFLYIEDSDNACEEVMVEYSDEPPETDVSYEGIIGNKEINYEFNGKDYELDIYSRSLDEVSFLINGHLLPKLGANEFHTIDFGDTQITIWVEFLNYQGANQDVYYVIGANCLDDCGTTLSISDMHVFINKHTYTQGDDDFEVSTILPEFMDCSYRLVSLDNDDHITLGSGGCVENGVTMTRWVDFPPGTWKLELFLTQIGTGHTFTIYSLPFEVYETEIVEEAYEVYDIEDMKVWTNKKKYERWESDFAMYTKLPEFMDCSYRLVSLDDNEHVTLGSGGCPVNDMAMGGTVDFPVGKWKLELFLTQPGSGHTYTIYSNSFTVYEDEEVEQEMIEEYDIKDMKVWTNKNSYTIGNSDFEMHTKLPGFMDCSYRLASLDGNEHYTLGSGGCPKKGTAMSGSIDFPVGVWRLEVFLNQPGQDHTYTVYSNSFKVKEKKTQNPPPVVIEEPKCDNGCLVELDEGKKCVPYFTRWTNGVDSYCSLDGVKAQKGSNELCQMNEECKINTCIDGKCLEQSILHKLFALLRSLFS